MFYDRNNPKFKNKKIRKKIVLENFQIIVDTGSKMLSKVEESKEMIPIYAQHKDQHSIFKVDMKCDIEIKTDSS